MPEITSVKETCQFKTQCSITDSIIQQVTRLLVDHGVKNEAYQGYYSNY